jgi:hypothetical protein
MTRRALVWLLLAAVLLGGGLLIAAVSSRPGTPLDPTSADDGGSRALVHVLARFGVSVSATTSLDTALAGGGRRAVVVTDPDAYSDAQLRRLTSVDRLVLIRPGTRAAAAADGLQPDPTREPADVPGCHDAGALAAGRVDLPGDALPYLAGKAGATSCYGGVLLTGPRRAVLGSADVLRNDTLTADGVAALDVNAITDSRRVRAVVWLRPGADAAGSGPASVWDLFPGGAYRAFWWLAAVLVLLAVWRARRLGGVVSEPLPVVVRAAELVEGHGRLYARAGARDRAAATLRTATVRRLGIRLGLPRTASADEVGAAVAPLVGRSPREVSQVLAGPVPSDDQELMRLARHLDELEEAAT